MAAEAKVRVLVLCQKARMLEILRKHEKALELTIRDEKMTKDWAESNQHAFDYCVSYGYRHIIRTPVIEGMFDRKRIINLHISYLPYNRGADPNLWSILERTPPGVTIHHIDEGVDTGNVLAQEKVELAADDTLRTSYDKLSTAIEDLFETSILPTILKRGDFGAGTEQDETKVTTHFVKDKQAFWDAITPSGLDTPIAEVSRLYREWQGSQVQEPTEKQSE